MKWLRRLGLFPSLTSTPPLSSLGAPNGRFSWNEFLLLIIGREVWLLGLFWNKKRFSRSSPWSERTLGIWFLDLPSSGFCIELMTLTSWAFSMESPWQISKRSLNLFFHLETTAPPSPLSKFLISSFKVETFSAMLCLARVSLSIFFSIFFFSFTFCSWIFSSRSSKFFSLCFRCPSSLSFTHNKSITFVMFMWSATSIFFT
mmetsp:Transcript_736/g.790  ORF Transcript_736/g.790 Transcript_736/m.790 type:complete len:202 (-) Transcript_736:881-1486(-)